MLGCFLELGLAAWGLTLLLRGEMKAPGGRRLSGPLVRAAGLIFLLPFPLAFVIGFSLGFSAAMKGQSFPVRQQAPMLAVIEIGIVLGCLALGGLLLLLASLGSAEPDHSARRDRHLDDFDLPFETGQSSEDPSARAPSWYPVAGADSVLDVVPVAPVKENPSPDLAEPRERSSNFAVIAAAILLFLAVAIGGAVLMK
jgi:hypothetical protein